MTKIFSDGADLDTIKQAAADPYIDGFTTNPTLMRQAGITDYASFAQEVIEFLASERPDTSISLEVFALDAANMKRQAKLIASWGEKASYDVYVKIPIVNPDGILSYSLIRELEKDGITQNVTALMSPEHIYRVMDILGPGQTKNIISIFSGRVADTGINPVVHFKQIKRYMYPSKDTHNQFLWASPRAVYDYYAAIDAGADIITMPYNMVQKMLKTKAKNLDAFEVDTSQMFFDDATASGYTL